MTHLNQGEKRRRSNQYNLVFEYQQNSGMLSQDTLQYIILTWRCPALRKNNTKQLECSPQLQRCGDDRQEKPVLKWDWGIPWSATGWGAGLFTASIGGEERRSEQRKSMEQVHDGGKERFYRRRDHLICSLADCRTCEGNKNVLS